MWSSRLFWKLTAAYAALTLVATIVVLVGGRHQRLDVGETLGGAEMHSTVTGTAEYMAEWPGNVTDQGQPLRKPYNKNKPDPRPRNQHLRSQRPIRRRRQHFQAR